MARGAHRELQVWIACGFLFLATALTYMDRQTLAVVAPVIQHEFRLDNSQLGLLFSAFFYTYGIMQVAVGLILDRVNLRWGYALAVFSWSCVALLTGLTQAIWQLFACQLLLGAAEAANWPGAMRIISRTLPPEKRSLANGFFTSGSSIGALITPPLVVWISVRWGWRGAFVAVGLLGIIWVLSWLVVVRIPKDADGGKKPRESPEAVKQSPNEMIAPLEVRSSWRQILTSRQFWGLIVASAFANPCLYFYTSWLPTYLVQQRGLSFSLQLGGTLVIPFLGLGLGYIFGGAAVLYLSRRKFGVAISRKLIMVVTAVQMLLAIAVPWAKTTAGAMALIFVVTMGLAAWQANYLSFVEEVSHKHVAGVSGVIGSAGAFSGALFVWLAGELSKGVHRFAPVFVALGIMPLVATMGVLVIMGRITVEIKEIAVTR